jgi:hypothetical protein
VCFLVPASFGTLCECNLNSAAAAAEVTGCTALSSLMHMISHAHETRLRSRSLGPGWRLVVLDTTEMSGHSDYPPDSRQFREAQVPLLQPPAAAGAAAAAAAGAAAAAAAAGAGEGAKAGSNQQMQQAFVHPQQLPAAGHARARSLVAVALPMSLPHFPPPLTCCRSSWQRTRCRMTGPR